MISTQHILAFTSPIQLEYLRGWTAALLFAALAAPIVLLGMRSLTGLGPVRKWVAIAARLLVLLFFVLILGGVRWTRVNKDLEVIVLRDISQSTQNVKDFPGKNLSESIETYLKDVSEQGRKPDSDRIGVISFHNQALIDAIPNEKLTLDARAIRDAGMGTDAASAIQLALATLGKDAMHRLVLMWDGNSTTGDMDTALAAAAAQGVQIDVMPLNYDVTNEVLVERFVAPTWKRENEPFSIEVRIRSTNTVNVSAKLTVTHNGAPMDLDPNQSGIQPSRMITLKPGPNVERVQVPPLTDAGVHQFHASIEGENVAIEGTPGSNELAAQKKGVDTLLQNNTADAFTFVRGKGKVLYIDSVADNRGQILRDALIREGIDLDTEHISVDQFPRSLIEMQNYDAVILANVRRGPGGIDDDQSKMLASYVHEMGGGLVMIGGDETFGAGGWQGSKLEQILPVDMDVPAQRQIPKGALVLIMHSCEMPDGNYWGEQCAIKAIEVLSAQDEIGVISFDWTGGGPQWDFPLEKKGDGSKVVAAVKNMKLGDMPSFDDTMDLALFGKNGVGGLINSDAKQKHVIIISDGDPQRPNQAITDAYLRNQVSVSTVSVYPHDTSDQGLPPTMRDIANKLKGRAYGPVNTNPNQLPQIFIKEATVVRRSLIHEDKNGIPLRLPPSDSELIKGVGDMPPVFGMVLTTKKNSPQVEVPIVGGANNDPILANWQTGLGKAAVFTSDAHNRWAANWVGSPSYDKFWAQVVRAVSRPPMSSDFEVNVQQNGDKGHISVEALTKDAAFLNFLSITGQVVGPDGTTHTVRLVQNGPGTYSGDFDVDQPGNYVGVMSYRGGAGNNATSGTILSGMAVNSSPELRDLRSNNAMLEHVRNATNGRLLKPFEAVTADMFAREGLRQTSSPLPIWDLLLPVLLALILIDVAIRRIAWDWNSTKKMALNAAGFVRSFTTTRKVETRQTLDALQGVRARATEQTQQAGATPSRPPAIPESRPDPTAKFQAKGVEGDITQVVGGATDKPVPSAPKRFEPKGGRGDGVGGMSSLMEAKRRAQRKIKEQEGGEGGA